MYIPNHFKISDLAIIHRIIEENSFSTIVSSKMNDLEDANSSLSCIQATHSPLILNEDQTKLIGHFARPNPQWKSASEEEVLCIFAGPHCYISPSWYETDRSVPTWNYVSVHVYGILKIQNDPNLIIQSMKRLIEKYEASDSTYQWKNLDPEYLNGMVKGVVGFEIEILRMEGKAKLSQNHSKERVESVISNLEKSNLDMDKQIAQWMREIR
ncbi:FMN-binding negative transcriptional regulator [Leptospira sp. GIMC2001]|uniref:FMN-binding negative transcriptional regulator n=1 Tax=Leptospira sp. GIMC2001 TaxID=1513297 RepID=UPI00234BD9EB|nr:FMN-binding negative transcriptional regulator [Leptospira sp. GIMC2001]WCL48585.1 FMN-binding negative transcriptional regulator [Leptospira sp. GIMC2001]